MAETIADISYSQHCRLAIHVQVTTLQQSLESWLPVGKRILESPHTFIKSFVINPCEYFTYSSGQVYYDLVSFYREAIIPYYLIALALYCHFAADVFANIGL